MISSSVKSTGVPEADPKGLTSRSAPAPIGSRTGDARGESAGGVRTSARTDARTDARTHARSAGFAYAPTHDSARSLHQEPGHGFNADVATDLDREFALEFGQDFAHDPTHDLGDPLGHASEVLSSGDTEGYRALAAGADLARELGAMDGRFLGAGRDPTTVALPIPAQTLRRDVDPFAVDAASVEHFSIAHPRWGQLDVDSHRSTYAWDIVVRCGDDQTRQLIRSREHEFRRLLGSEFGMSLELDMQPASSS